VTFSITIRKNFQAFKSFIIDDKQNTHECTSSTQPYFYDARIREELESILQEIIVSQLYQKSKRKQVLSQF
jgi:hypothetical protein